jgi:(S)-ureidoglycine-glyoxylate aminotransferase
MITPIVVPDGVDELRVRHELLHDFGIEIGAAFGPLAGRIWRIGTLGYSASRQNVLLCLAALEHALRRQGWRAAAGAGVEAAAACYRAAGAVPDADGAGDNLAAPGAGRY